jgi:hypothetical protein
MSDNVTSNALAALGDAIPTTSLSTKEIAEMSKVGEYTPPIRLMQKQSEAVENEAIGIRSGQFLWDTDTVLGNSFNCIPLCMRPHAMRMENKAVKFETFNKDSQEYKDIMVDQSKKPKVEGAMAGADILVYVPGRGFAICFLYGTNRQSIPDFVNNAKKAITVQSEKVETTKYTWNVWQVVPCTTQLSTDDITEDQLKAEVAKFLNPVAKTPGTVVDEAGRPR